MHDNLLQSKPLDGVLHQHVFKQVSQRVIEHMREDQHVICDFLAELDNVLGDERRVAEPQHEHSSTKSPNIRPLAAKGLVGVEELGGHERRRAGGVDEFCPAPVQHFGNTEICNFDHPVFAHEEVLGLL